MFDWILGSVPADPYAAKSGRGHQQHDPPPNEYQSNRSKKNMKRRKTNHGQNHSTQALQDALDNLQQQVRESQADQQRMQQQLDQANRSSEGSEGGVNHSRKRRRIDNDDAFAQLDQTTYGQAMAELPVNGPFRLGTSNSQIRTYANPSDHNMSQPTHPIWRTTMSIRGGLSAAQTLDQVSSTAKQQPAQRKMFWRRRITSKNHPDGQKAARMSNHGLAPMSNQQTEPHGESLLSEAVIIEYANGIRHYFPPESWLMALTTSGLSQNAWPGIAAALSISLED